MTTYSPRSPIRTTDPLRIDTQALAAYVVRLGAERVTETRAYIDAVVSGALQLGIDPVVMLAQWWVETDAGRSVWWKARLNPAGLGITGDADQNAASQMWTTGTDSAIAHIAHMCSYVYGSGTFARWPATWPDVLLIDKRFPAPIAAGYSASVLDDLTNTWAVDNRYGQKLADRASAIARDFAAEVTPAVEPEGDDMAVTFGRVPKPAMVEMIVSKPAHTGSAYGYDYCPPRKPVGLVHHETQGRGTGQWYHDFFSCPNGERCRNALVDFLIDKAGTIFLFNDPFGTRAGWANGGGVGSPGGLEGDGPAFYAKFGASGINQRLVSIEYVKTTDENFTDAQVQAGGALAAWIHDRDGQRWDEHPFTSKYGLVTSFLHFEFGTTNCGKGELDDITRVQAVTKGIMRKWQDGGKDDPVDPDVPPLPEPEIPGGLTLAQATERFGKATRHNKDGTVQVDRFGFDPQGPISLSWAHRAAAEKVWPEIEDWYVLEDSGETFQIVTFANDWRLMQVAERQGWQWIAFTAVTA